MLHFKKEEIHQKRRVNTVFLDDISHIVENMANNGLINSEQAKHIIELEKRSENAFEIDFLNDPTISEIQKIEAKKILLEIQKEEQNFILTKPNNPNLTIIAGSAGCGKSFLVNQANTNNDIYICGDEIKRKFFEKAQQNHVLKHLTQVSKKDSPYFHRFTSNLSWDLFNFSLENKKKIILEMIGSGGEYDFKDIIQKANKLGYKIDYNLVTAHYEEVVKRIVLRYINEPDSRFISIRNAIQQLEEVFSSFVINKTLTKNEGLKNVNFKLFQSIPNQLIESNEQNVSNNFKKNISKLWFTGNNMAVDNIPLIEDNEGNIHLLLIKRSDEKEQKYALAGGFVNTTARRGENFLYDPTYENFQQASLRELNEEIKGLNPISIEDLQPVFLENQNTEFNTYGFDPRSSFENYISTRAFIVPLKENLESVKELMAGDDAVGLTTICLGKKEDFKHIQHTIQNIPFSFEHHRILLEKGLKQFLKIEDKQELTKKSLFYISKKDIDSKLNQSQNESYSPARMKL